VIFLGGDDKDGYYCSICGGIPPDKIKTRRILIDGKETGIDQLDFVLAEVRKLNLNSQEEIAETLVNAVNRFNYVPTKKREEYKTALLKEYLEKEG